jgi:16S rRNA (cytosine967-C5)-methyltransferase
VVSEGAWASPALDAEIGRAGLDRRDAGLATEIVYGALRVLPALDARFEALLTKQKKVDPVLRAALQAATYQIVHLSRVPAHAAVSDAVSIVREVRGPRLAGVANAVLRKLAATRPEEPAPPTRLVLARWIEDELRASLGDARAEAFLGARTLPPPLGLRAVGREIDALVRALREAHPEAEIARSALASRGAWARGIGDPRALPGWTEGWLAAQELGSQRVVDLVEPRLGDRIADLCCGHGTKTLALAERVGEGGTVEGVDLYEEKLELLEVERARLGLANVDTRAVDLRVGTGGLEAGSFDRVVLDAPCSGLGTIHRRPELALRLTAADPERLAALQRELLPSAASLVKEGGLLVYAVCSPTSAEGPAVAGAFERDRDDLERVFDGADPDGVIRIGPWLGEDLDAYQVVRWRRRG